MTKEERIKAVAMREEGISQTEISKILGVPYSTVKSFFNRHGINGSHTVCENCGKTITQTPHKKKRRFCPDKCRWDWWNNHTEESDRKAYYSQICAYCGKEFTFYGYAKRTYCGRACYAKARQKDWADKQAEAERQKASCGAKLQDLPADCLCVNCRWFVDEKRSCTCKEKAEKDV